MDAAERLTVLRFDKKVQAVQHDRLGQRRTKEGLQGTVHQLLLTAFGHPAGQGKGETVLLKNVRVPPHLQVPFFLAAERLRLVFGQFARIEWGTQPIEGTGTAGGQGLEGGKMPTGTEAERTVNVAESKGR